MQQTGPYPEIESSLAKPWEREASFQDDLYDWMQRAPWLGLSAGAHLVAFFVLSAIPWSVFDRPEEAEFKATIDTPPETVFEDPPEPEEEIIEEIDTEETPVINDIEVAETPETDNAEDFDEAVGDPDQFDAAPFDMKSFNKDIGIGGGAGGIYGQRGRGGDRSRGGRKGTAPSLQAGLQWLANHQGADGSWSPDGFMHDHADGSCDCDGEGNANQHTGVTGLALLAFLGDGNTTSEGLYRETVGRGIRWLVDNQDYDTGLYGEDIGKDYLYDHAIATLAICEAYYFSKSPYLKSSAKKALRLIERARDPYGAWRYDVPSVGQSDTSVTGWMVLALKSAKEGGIKVDNQAFEGALAWIDEATDPGSGRVGYDQMGSSSARVTDVNDHFPTDKGEAMTAVGLLSRFFLGQNPSEHPEMEQHADLLLRTLPEWDPEGFGCDMYYWYYGSYAMFQMGGKHWQRWNAAMKEAVVGSQRKDGHARGSWDPAGPWGHAGGRVYSTALMVLCLEVYFRYGRIVGAR